MLRTLAIITALIFAAPAAHADAETVRARIVSILQDEGYAEIRISRTLLGRMRFVGSRSDARREIVVNPNSGVVLRDYVRFLNTGSAGSSGSSGNSGGTEDDDDDDRDEEDEEDEGEEEEEESDNSGHGGGDDEEDEDDEQDEDNSGSGSSNSGSGSDDDDDDD